MLLVYRYNKSYANYIIADDLYCILRGVFKVIITLMHDVC